MSWFSRRHQSFDEGRRKVEETLTDARQVYIIYVNTLIAAARLTASGCLEKIEAVDRTYQIFMHS